MDPLTVAAASGLRTKIESLDMLSNNLANAGTGGYKKDREFYGLFVAPEAGDAAGANSGASPGALPVIQKPWIDFSQGVLQTTGNQSDLALASKGFFVVRTASGPAYTRNGSFRFSTAGELVTAEGYPLQLDDGRSLRVQPEKPLDVAADGTVRQDGQVLGRLRIADFPDTSVLVKMGNSYFRAADPNMQPAALATPQVQQGKLENSNVSPAESAVRLVSVMRQFEMLQKAVTLGVDMNRKAIEEVARVGQ